MAIEPKNKFTEKPVLIETLGKASSYRDRFVFTKVDGAVCGAGEKALGVLNVDADEGENLSVMCEGIAIVKAGGAVSAGVEVESDASGRAIPKNSGKVNGLSLTASAQAGDFIRVLLK